MESSIPISEAAYFAGLFDGEGSIGITRQYEKGRDYPYCGLICNVQMIDEPVVRSLYETFGGGFHQAKRRGRDTHRPIWQWRVCGEAAGEFLRVLLPYLRVKLPQALIAMGFLETRQPPGALRWHHTHEEKLAYWNQREELRDRIMKLNSGGHASPNRIVTHI